VTSSSCSPGRPIRVGRDPQKPNGAIALVWIGFGVLLVSLVVSGIALIVAGASAA